MDYKQLINQFGSPLFVYDFDIITQKYNALKDAFKARKSLICYAMKANSNLSLLKHFATLNSGCDCVSLNEIKKAIKAGIKPYKIIFSGVGKSDDEIKEAINLGILFINIESFEEFERVEFIANDLQKMVRISVRINPNIDAKTHPAISTGLKENKFGVSVEVAKKIYLKAKNSPFLEPVGIHFHIGSQICELEPIKAAAKIASDLVRSLKKIDIDIKFFDIGGGIGVRYKDENVFSLYDYAQVVLGELSGLDLTIVCESGRYLVSECGVLLSKVLYEKQNDQKRFVIIDAAMNDLIRPSLYGAFHKIEVLGKSEEKSLCDVVGPVCESGDFLAKNYPLAKTKKDDIVMIFNAGAYAFSMSSNYNSRLRCAEVGVLGGEVRLIRKKESFEDLISLEEICL